MLTTFLSLACALLLYAVCFADAALFGSLATAAGALQITMARIAAGQ